MRLKELSGNLLLAILAGAVGLGLGLCLLAWLAPANPVIYQVDGDCLMRLLPGATKHFRHLRVNGGESVTVHVNALGLRGDDLTLARHDRPRVVVYGDSFVEGEFSPTEKTFCARLESWLDADGVAAQVLNAGVVGYGPDQVSVRMESELALLKPDLVVLAIASGNDFGDLLRDKLFRLDPAGRLVRGHPVLHWSLRSHLASLSAGEALGEGLLARQWRRLRWALVERYLERTGGFEPRPGEDVVEWSLQACRREYEDDVLQANDVVVNLLLDHYDADVALRPEADSSRYKVALMEQVVARIRDTVAARGSPLLLVLIPDAIDVCPGHHYVIRRESLASQVPSRLTDVLEGIAGRLGVPCVNLFGPFRRGAPEHLYYHDPESHWDSAGEDLAAQVTARALLSHGLLRPGVHGG